MARTRIVTDSGSDLDADLVSALNIAVAPWRVRIGPDLIDDAPALRTTATYETINKLSTLPAAVPPSSRQIQQLYGRLAQETDQIVSIHSSGKLARTIEAANKARGEFLGRCDIHVIDSTLLSRSVGILVVLAARFAQQGLSAGEIVRKVNGAIPMTYLGLYLPDPTPLASRGLIDLDDEEVRGTPTYKPLLLVEDGRVMPLKRSRKRGEPADRIVEFVAEFNGLAELHFLHAGDSPLMDQVRTIMEEDLPEQAFAEEIYGPVLASLVGTEAFGIAALEN